MDNKPTQASQLAEYIKSGQYFQDARQWYATQYIAPFTEKVWLIILCALTSLFFLLTVYNVMHLMPLEEEMPYILQVEDADSQSVGIEPLFQREDDAWVAISMHLVKEYITVWESYKFSNYRGAKLAERKQRMRRSSSKNVYQEYLAYLSNSNPRSPIRLYRNEAERDVSFSSVTFTRLDESSAKVDINFTAAVNQLKSGKQKKAEWQAEVFFQLPAIDPESQKGVSLGFLVTSYKVTSAQ